MNRWISLLLALLLVLPVLPLPAPAAAEDAAPEEGFAAGQEDSLIAELEKYGSVEAAMDAYAREVFEKYYQQQFDTMLDQSTNTFRQLAVYVEGTDDDPNWLSRFLLEIGYSAIERDFDFASRTNQVQLYTNYLLGLADMEEISFESVKHRAAELAPQPDMAMETLTYAIDLLSFGASKLADAAIINTGKKQSQVYADLYTDSSLSFDEIEELYAHNMTQLYQGPLSAKAVLTSADRAKKGQNLVSSALVLSNLNNVTNAYEKAYGGLAMLDSMQPQTFDDPYFADACDVLRQTYWDYLTALSQITVPERLGREYLDGLFNTLLQDNLLELITGKHDYRLDNISTIASIALEEVADKPTFELASIGRKTIRMYSEQKGNAISYLTLFHTVSILNEIYDQFAEVNENAAPAAWKEYIAYAKNTRRMVCLAGIGEEVVYQMYQLDASATIKFWNLAMTQLGRRTLGEYGKDWYTYRIGALQTLHDMTEEYIADLLEHYAALSAVVFDTTGLEGYADKAVCTLRGGLNQGEYFAKPDGSGEADESRPNPDKGQPVEGVKVQLLADKTVIAEADSTSSGAFVLTFDRALAAGHKLTLRVGEPGGGKFAMQEIPLGAGVQITFPASFGWNPIEQTPADASTWAAQVPVIYADEYFVNKTSTTSREMLLYSLGLAAAAMSRSTADGSISGASGSSANIERAMSGMGFDVLETEHYSADLNTLIDHVPYAIGTRVTQEFGADKDDPKHRIFVLAVGGDVDVPAMAAIWHRDGKLLDEAAADMVQPLLSRMQAYSNDGETLHLWVTGFSWGGSIADRACTLIRSEFEKAGMDVKIHLYTFGAPGEMSREGTHIAYEQDLIATGLIHDSGRQQLLRNVDAGSMEQKIIASVFHQLCGEQMHYNPWWYHADPTLHHTLRYAHADCEQLDNLFAATAMWSFTNSTDGTDFRLNTPDDRKKAIADYRGTVSGSSARKMEETALDALSYAGIPVFTAMPEDIGEEYKKIILTILEAAARLSGSEHSFSLSERDKESLVAMYLQADEELHNPTSPYSLAFPHRPEMYFAWVMGAETATLGCAEEGYLFNAELLPLPANLKGTVVDKETQTPLAGATVTVTGGNVSMTLTTNDDGCWETYVDPGAYQVSFSSPGYRNVTRSITRDMFGNTAIELQVELELSSMPYLKAKLGDFTRYDNGEWYITPEIMSVYAKPVEEGVRAPEVKLSLTIKQSGKYSQVYDSLTIDCGWLEPYTLHLPTTYNHSGNEYFGLMTGVYFYAADMGDGKYTHILELVGEGPIYCTKVIVLREAEGRLYEALSFDYLGDTTCLHGPDPINTYIDYTQASPGNSGNHDIANPGIFRQEAMFRQEAAGTYNLELWTTECTDESSYCVKTRYRLIDGVLTIVAQWVDLPYVQTQVGTFKELILNDGQGGVWSYEYVTSATAESTEKNHPAPDITLSLTQRYEALTISCGWLSSYTIPLPDEDHLNEPSPFSYTRFVQFFAMDMGDGKYTYVVRLCDDELYEVGKVLVLRESEGHLYTALEFRCLGMSDCVYGETPRHDGWLDYTQAEWSRSAHYGVGSFTAWAEKQPDGTYDLLIAADEFLYHHAHMLIQTVVTRYRLVDGELTIIDQVVNPSETGSPQYDAPPAPSMGRSGFGIAEAIFI